MGPSVDECGTSVAKACASIAKQTPDSQAVLEGILVEQSAEWLWEFVVAKLVCKAEQREGDGAGKSKRKLCGQDQCDEVPVSEILEHLENLVPRPQKLATFRRRLNLLFLAEGVKGGVVNKEFADLLEELKDLCKESPDCQRSPEAAQFLEDALLAVAAVITLEPIRRPDADWEDFERRRRVHFPVVLVPDTLDEGMVEGSTDRSQTRTHKDIYGVTKDLESWKLKRVLDRHTAEMALGLLADFVERDAVEAGPTVIERIHSDIRGKRYLPQWKTKFDGGVAGERGAEGRTEGDRNGMGKSSGRFSKLPGVYISAYAWE